MVDMVLIRSQSSKNLERLLKKIEKYKIKRDDVSVETTIKSLPIFHCVPATNIIEVIKSQNILVKNRVMKGEHTNLSTDFFQGFDKHLSMSIGEPWVEYGQYAFAFGLEHIHEDSLCFSADPWLWGVTKFQNHVLVKDDFIIYARALLVRNLFRVYSKLYMRLPWNADLHRLAVRNFRKWEVKQADDLSILDAEEFFIWTGIDRFVYQFVRMFGNSPMFLMISLLLALLVWGVYN